MGNTVPIAHIALSIMYAENTDTYLEAAKAAAMLTPHLFGGEQAISRASHARSLRLDLDSMESDQVKFCDRAYALMVQSITSPQKVEALASLSGATLTAGRLIPTLGYNKRKALARLMMAVPVN